MDQHLRDYLLNMNYLWHIGTDNFITVKPGVRAAWEKPSKTYTQGQQSSPACANNISTSYDKQQQWFNPNLTFQLSLREATL